LSDRETLLNDLLTQLPTPWPGVRADALTHQYALEYMRKEEPRLLYVAFGETDDYAHDRRYAQYLQAAHRADAMIRQLWEWVQSTRGYRDETTLIITTDHGRGDGRFWSDHWSLIEGAQHTWLAVIGPDTPASGERLAGQFYQNQIARTIAALLGYDVDDERMGAVIGPLFKQAGR
jgi:phosphopentomutase